MPAVIEEVSGTYTHVKIFFETSKHARFYMRVTQDGLEFYRRENSAGTLLDKPVILSADDLFEIIGDDGDKKPFRDRKEVIKGVK